MSAKRILNVILYTNALFAHSPGEKAQVEVMRGLDTVELKVTLGEARN